MLLGKYELSSGRNGRRFHLAICLGGRVLITVLHQRSLQGEDVSIQLQVSLFSVFGDRFASVLTPTEISSQLQQPRTLLLRMYGTTLHPPLDKAWPPEHVFSLHNLSVTSANTNPRRRRTKAKCRGFRRNETILNPTHEFQLYSLTHCTLHPPKRSTIL